MTKPLHVIASPHAGTKATTINDLKAALDRYGVSYQLKIAKDPSTAYRIAKKLTRDTCSAVAAFGGDGTVIAVLKAAFPQQLPALILPGGSGNAIARGLSMPSDIDSCIKLFASGAYSLRYLNVALMGKDEPFFLDLHAGAAAETVMDTPRSLKRRFGKAAYYLSGLRQLRSAERQQYELTIDGKDIAMTGCICMVVNEGEHRFLGAPIFSWPLAGSLSVAVVRSMKLPHLLLWWLVRETTGHNLSSILKTWRGQKVSLRRIPTTILADDAVVKVKLPLEIRMSPYSTMAIAPVPEAASSLRNFWLVVRTNVYRYADHLKRLILGVPSRDYCQVSPSLYVGGQFRSNAYQRFKSWGITGIVSMQERRPRADSISHMKILHLPTRDYTAPTLRNLTRGAEFISEQIDAGGAVYVHCRWGEGRGPTMAIAYLMHRGMKLEDAVRAIRKFRPFIRLNRLQLRQLARWQERKNPPPPIESS
jgi:diacylglycerol kinase family enzyme